MVAGGQGAGAAAKSLYPALQAAGRKRENDSGVDS